MFKKHVAFLLLAVLLALPAFASAEEKWIMMSNSVNQGNRFSSGSGIDDKVVFAIGTNGTTGTIKMSSDGGKTMSDLALPTAQTLGLSSIQMFSANDGLITSLGAFYRLKDKGQTYEALNVPGKPTTCLYSTCVAKTHCYFSCAKGVIAITHDAGATWSTSTLSVTDLNAGPIAFYDATTGYVADDLSESNTDGQGQVTQNVLSRGTIFKTTDGGKTWTKKIENEPYQYTALEVVAPDRFFIGAQDNTHGYLRYSQDGGTTLKTLPVTETKQGSFGSVPLWHIGGIKFFDEQKGWVVVSYGSLAGGVGNLLFFLKTTDGGTTFTEFLANKTAGGFANGSVYGWSWVNEHLAYAFGEMQTVIQFSDGQYVPPAVDGDVDRDNEIEYVDDDGELVPVDGDPDTDTAPVYKGAPGDPCPVPGKPDTYAHPRCDANLGSGVCAWKEGHAPFCTAICTKNADPICLHLNPDSGCKPIDYNGVASTSDTATRICLFQSSDLTNYSGAWQGYSGALLGEACWNKNHAANPRCDSAKSFGGDFCLEEPDNEAVFCSKYCSSESDCAGGFATTACCNGVVGDKNYCRYGALCTPAVDGDTEITPSEDGDTESTPSEDGDTSDPTIHKKSDGGGCQSTGSGAGLALLALFGLAVLRRRQRV